MNTANIQGLYNCLCG